MEKTDKASVRKAVHQGWGSTYSQSMGTASHASRIEHFFRLRVPGAVAGSGQAFTRPFKPYMDLKLLE